MGEARIYDLPSWKTARAYWKDRLTQGLTCARCGGQIDPTPGERGPWSLQVGHVLGVPEARAQGWPDEAINALRNTQPEHAKCNHLAGQRTRVALGRARRAAPGSQSSGEWRGLTGPNGERWSRQW